MHSLTNGNSRVGYFLVNEHGQGNEISPCSAGTAHIFMVHFSGCSPNPWFDTHQRQGDDDLSDRDEGFGIPKRLGSCREMTFYLTDMACISHISSNNTTTSGNNAGSKP